MSICNEPVPVTGPKPRSEFAVRIVSDQTITKAMNIGLVFSRCLDEIETLCGAGGREMSLVRTKLQEACYFAKLALAVDPANQQAAAPPAPCIPIEVNTDGLQSVHMGPVGTDEEHAATGHRDGRSGMPPRSQHPAYVAGHHRGLAEHEGAPGAAGLTTDVFPIDRAKEIGKADALGGLKPRSEHPLYVEGYDEGLSETKKFR